jgi:hypothetical protein
MKYPMIIKSIAGASMLLGSLNVMATGFGGGWSLDSHTGTLMNTNAPSHVKQPQAVGDKQVTFNSFGGDKYQNKTTGTLCLLPKGNDFNA